jgi:ATP-dependent Lon protease
MAQYGSVPADLMSKFSLEIYTDPVDAAFKAIGVR